MPWIIDLMAFIWIFNIFWIMDDHGAERGNPEKTYLAGTMYIFMCVL
jgi:hypothetical protein